MILERIELECMEMYGNVRIFRRISGLKMQRNATKCKVFGEVSSSKVDKSDNHTRVYELK